MGLSHPVNVKPTNLRKNQYDLDRENKEEDKKKNNVSLKVRAHRVRSVSQSELPPIINATPDLLHKRTTSEHSGNWGTLKLSLKQSHSAHIHDSGNMNIINNSDRNDDIEIIIENKENEIDKEHKESIDRFAMEITSKLEMIQRKSEFNPTIVRRLQYQNKLVPVEQNKTSFRSNLHLNRSLSEPSSPKRIASFLGIKNRTSLKKTFDDDTEIDYNYSAMTNQIDQHDQKEEIEIIVEDTIIENIIIEDEEMKIDNNDINHLPLPTTNMSWKRSMNRNKLKLENTASCPTKPNDLSKRQLSFGHRRHNSLNDDDLLNGDNNNNNNNNNDDMNKKNKDRLMKFGGDELVNGLNVLVLQGFYSRKSLNSCIEIRKYNKNARQIALDSIKE